MEMEYAPAPTVLFFPPPFPPPSPKAIDVSSLEFILVLLAVIPIAAIIYAFFFTIKCPRRRSSGSSFSHGSGPRGGTGEEGAVSGLEFTKDAAADAHIGDECPVCLSAFAAGEEIRQLSACKHAFHTACIDPWLSSHSNCPICRAVVGVKTPSSTSTSSSAAATWGGGDDAEHHQVLPDASFLV